jgi:hypothetical protein
MKNKTCVQYNELFLKLFYSAYQPPASSTFFSEQISTSHQPNEQAAKLLLQIFLKKNSSYKFEKKGRE